MTIELELWQVISLGLSFLGASAAAGKMLLAQTQRHLDARFTAQEEARSTYHEQIARRLDAMESVAREEAGNWQRIERDLLRLQADMPLHYVRREDYIRGQSVIEAKLDALGNKIEMAQLRLVAQGGGDARN